MDLRRAFFSRSMKLLRHRTVVRWLADPRAMDAFVVLVQTTDNVKERLRQAAANVKTVIGALSGR